MAFAYFRRGVDCHFQSGRHPGDDSFAVFDLLLLPIGACVEAGVACCGLIGMRWSCEVFCFYSPGVARRKFQNEYGPFHYGSFDCGFQWVTSLLVLAADWSRRRPILPVDPIDRCASRARGRRRA